MPYTDYEGGDLSRRQKAGVGFGSAFVIVLIIVAIWLGLAFGIYDGELDPTKWSGNGNNTSCPNGQVKNNAGNCVNASVPCPNGQVKNNAGNCVIQMPNVNPNAINGTNTNLAGVNISRNGNGNGNVPRNVPANVPKPGDCQMGDWGEWSDCSANCGGGTQVRSRFVLKNANVGGASCPPLTETRPCGEEACSADYVPEHLAIDDFVRFTGAMAEGGHLMDVPNMPPGVESTGLLIRASAEDCQKFCGADEYCDVVQFQKQILAFDGQPGCSLHAKHPARDNVSVYVDNDAMLLDGSYRFDSYCTPGTCRKV